MKLVVKNNVKGQIFLTRKNSKKVTFSKKQCIKNFSVKIQRYCSKTFQC